MLAKEIEKMALSLGYHSCGIIKVDDVSDYADKLTERITRTPENKEKYSGFYSFAQPQKAHPWAKSIVVCVQRYGKYRVPPHTEGLIAKYYLMDGRRDENAPEYQTSVAFEQYLRSTGMQVKTERKFGLTALRWAAHKAGLGIIRRNNFFYADCGSWVYLEAFLIDEELVLRHESALKPCPPECDRCIRACPTQSLSAPYTMSRATCISCLTTWDGDDLTTEPHSRQMGAWIYGCDACQDACPFNHKKWEEREEYPNLAELCSRISLTQLVTMEYDTLSAVIQPKFWYIGKDRLWKWKVNALNAMRNNYDPQYDEAIRCACDDENEHVRHMAHWVRDSLLTAEKHSPL